MPESVNTPIPKGQERIPAKSPFLGRLRFYQGATQVKSVIQKWSIQLTNSKSPKAPTPMHFPSSFYTTELHRALTEQSFGIESFQITSSTAMQAAALVTLLEGNIILVNLTTGGYFIENHEVIHETIEALLQSASPLFGRRQQEQLMKKLAALS